MDGHIRVQLGIRRARHHFDLVAQIAQGPAQVPQVDALTAAVRVAAVAQHADAQGALGGRDPIGVVGCHQDFRIPKR